MFDSTTQVLLFFVSSLIVLIGIFYFYYVSDSKEKENKTRREQEDKDRIRNIRDIKSRLTNFNVTNEYFSPDKKSAIFLDEEHMEICIVWDDLSKYKVYEHNELVQIEIIIDGESITKTNRKNQFKGAVMGGLLAGNVGALIGGLSSETNTEKEIKSIDLKVVVDDLKQPNHVINFLSASINKNENETILINKNSESYKDSLNKIEYWYNILTVLVKRANKEVAKNYADNNEKDVPKSNNIDDLNNLAQLYKEGLLTREEFENEKKKLLNSNII